MKNPSRPSVLGLRESVLGLMCLVAAGQAQAWVFTINSAGPRVFLHVGDGTFDDSNSAINLVSVTVDAGQNGNGSPLVMMGNSTQSSSLLSSASANCSAAAGQIMIGASYRRNNGNGFPPNVPLSVTSPANLVSLGGASIPISQISWTVSSSDVIAAGTFNGSTQQLATVAANTYIQNCLSFVYANSAPREAGTYTGRVTYTLTIP